MIATGLLVFFPLVLHFFLRTALFMNSIEEALGAPAREIGKEILEYIPNLGYLIIIFALGWVILRMMRYFCESVQAETLALPNFDPEWAMPTYSVGRTILLLFLLMVSFPYLPEAGSRLFRGFSLFVGAMLTLGGAGAVGNILAGVILTYTGAFWLGDKVSIGETTGKVSQKSLLVTRIKTNRNITVTIPNTTIVSSPVLNYTKEARNGLVLTVTAGIGYEVDWREVHRLTIDAAHQTESILPEPAPCVWQESLDDYAVKYQLRASTNRPERMEETHSSLRRNVLDSFNRAGVEIMTPSVLAHREASPLAVPSVQGQDLPDPRRSNQ